MLDLVMMALGSFRFGVNRANYQVFSRNAPFRWAKQERLGRSPALQYLGPDTEEITLEGVIYPHFKGGLRQVEIMRLTAATGVPLMLVDGLGFVWKRWCITAVDERKSFLMADGSPRKIEFSVSLQSHGGDIP
ncbi:MAG: phage tail protein [Fuscovulum sp.]|nr:phage tail protein [Fuscovulum sp.]